MELHDRVSYLLVYQTVLDKLVGYEIVIDGRKASLSSDLSR